MNSIENELLKAIESFEQNYKDILDESKVDPNIGALLYDLGATIKHTFDYFAESIIKLEK
ncbi:hypothetical protein [Acetobacterium malicum]|uniref:hypothetical protein n=1 Tax=Acetobacterium malicum TaxID=52692 RepID=UPI0035942CE5